MTYVESVLHFYRHLPQTTGRCGAVDRLLAQDLQRRGVPLKLVEAALCLAALRRLLRPPEALPLPPIRSLHYILPILDELQDAPPLEDGYLEDLHQRLQRFAQTGS